MARDARSRMTTWFCAVSQAIFSTPVTWRTAATISVSSCGAVACGTGTATVMVCSRSLRFCGLSFATISSFGLNGDDEGTGGRFQGAYGFAVVGMVDAEPDASTGLRIVAVVHG